ncbi:probable methyltransferase PMT19 isoform X2 [Sorghum bicolor]|uniref:probable methyltransferase PMT19 isoform X2 n=1 Tax=Sorghum bicolor TaxID=4558 RepID=UPI000B4247C9|nr:probable methyltransferase PMT19 isoform X2 [Sorghum bicolor]|eukprot:XP_021310879.1 probable methyltransferase PMT19 isoform X2 [Sorghum bicolor]
MPLSVPSTPAVLKALPRALSLAAAVVAATTASLLLICAVVSNSHHAASSSSPQLPPSASASTAALAPAPAPDGPDHHHPHPHPPPPVPPCPPNATHDVPCHEPPSGERHCPPRPPPPPPHPPKDPPPHPPPPPPHCRVPPPPGYRPPPPWPARRDRARYANVDLPPPPPVKVAAGLEQDPVRRRGEWLVFTEGVRDYVEQLERVVPLRGGVVRTALDIGCGVASFGDYLLNYGVLTMSIAPRNNRLGPQVQLALERGLPAMIGALVAHRLPYPSRSFDMVHCADCLVPWTAHDGLYILEIDRLLQPGGYWVFSKPPVKWKSTYNISNQGTRDMQNNQLAMDYMLNKLHWTRVSEEGTISVWRKPSCHLHCNQEANAKLLGLPPLCTGEDPDSAWYANISMCMTCIPRAETFNGCAGGAMEKWPKRLHAVPPRITSGEMKGNVMDMSAGFGGFAAAMSKHPVWVMNVVPANRTENTLGVIYERGLIGTYTDWCEAFSTYPRTYDLIHGNGIFSSHIHKCGIIDILVEMDRVLRPGGAVIVRDRADVVLKVKKDADRLKWSSRVVDTENGPLDPEKLLIVDNSLPLRGS